MIRSEELLDKLIADLHFHNYLEIMGSDIMNQNHNVVATKPKLEVIINYIDDVFIDYFFRSQCFKIIVIPRSFYSKRYSKDGLISVNEDIELDLSNVYDRYTFVHIINLLFSTYSSPIPEISKNNSFFNAFNREERIFAPYCRCFTPIMEMPNTHIFEQYLDFMYGYCHSLFNPQYRAKSVREFGLYFKENWLKFTIGETSYGQEVLNNRFNDYRIIKKNKIFGDYTIEDLLLLYSILVEKMQLQDDNLLSFISLFVETSENANSLIYQFDKFEKEHTDYHEIEPFIKSNDLYLRFTSPERSKAFKFSPINNEILEIQQFNYNPIRSIYSDNSLPLPYFYNSIDN